MEDLTQRQIDILKTIIKEYSENGDAVGSGIIEKKYKLGVSPATIRNEMVVLAKKGYLKKTHFSSGRVPSAKAFRFYIKNLMKEREVSTAEEVAYKNGVWDERKESHRLLSQATKILSQKTGLLSLSATDHGDLYYSGISNILNMPEFFNIDLSRHLFLKLDENAFWTRMLSDFDELNEDVMYMLGEDDFSDPLFEPCASIFGEFKGAEIKGVIGVVGPKRMYYEIVSPQVKYFSGLLSEILKTQQA